MSPKFREKSLEEQNKIFRNHRRKFEFLVDEISKLKKERPILKLAAFLIEIQEIEFHLMILLTELDLVSSMEPNLIKVKSLKSNKRGSKKNKDPFEMTLGEKKNKLDLYKAPFLAGLKSLLSELNKLRRRYSHHLFSGLDEWSKVQQDVKEGLELNSRVMKQLYKIGQIINNSKWGKIADRKIK